MNICVTIKTINIRQFWIKLQTQKTQKNLAQPRTKSHNLFVRFCLNLADFTVKFILPA